ncbi:MAG: hypothetical protein ACXVCY_01785 [Pseudobdellovibrionaceae bacterium]
MKTMFRFVKQLSIILAMMVAVECSSFAQTSRPGGVAVPVGKEAKKTTLNFEDELVEGATQKPELFYLFQKKNFNYTRLIKLRENFLPEMRRTTEDIQRVRGGN